MASLKIAITIGRGTEDVTQMLWGSGLIQNIVYLVMLLNRLPEVAVVNLVDCSEHTTPHPLAEWCGIASITQTNAVESQDIIIELGARLEDRFAQQFRNRRGRLVSYMAGNSMVMNFECVALNLPYGESYSPTGFDAVWITPQHWHTNRALAEMTRSPATEMVPHIWEPVCLESAVRASKVRYFWQDRDPSKPFSIGTLAPNINVVKTFQVPLLACEEAYRSAPALIDRLLLFNTLIFKGLPHFEEIIAATSLGRANRVFAEGRWMISNVLGTHIDAVIEHQWENELNYVYWDVLYSGYPLIHNSAAIEGAGYYFKSFDTQDGGRAIVDALSRHPGRVRQSRIEAIDFLWRFRVDNPAVQARHSELIEKVMG